MPLPVAFLLACAVQCTDPPPPPSGFSYDEQVDLEVTFTDGETTNVVVRMPRDPAGPCGWPLIVFTHGLFGQRTSVAHLAREFAEAGYATLTYDVRGHDTASGYHTLWGQRERLDLVELIQWTQASYPGLVDPTRTGLGGVSQGGILSFDGAAWSGLPIEPNPWMSGTYPTIAAIVVENFSAEFSATFAPDGLGMHTNAAAALLSNTSVRFDPQLVAQAANAVLNDDPASWNAIAADPTRDPGPLVAALTTPVFAMSAWDDFWFPTEKLVETLNTLPASTPRCVYLGTGGHSSPSNDAERDQRNVWRRDWFDRWLKGVAGSTDALPNFTYAVTPSDVNVYLDELSTWEHGGSAVWPPADSLAYRLYVADNGELWPFAPSGLETSQTLTQQVAPGFGAQQLLDTEFRWAQVEPNVPLAALTWDSRPLTAPLRFVGDPIAHLALRPLALQWQVTVSVWDVDEFGVARYITSGSHFGAESAPSVFVNPVSVHLGSNAYEFSAGHKIRMRLQNVHVHEPATGALLRYAPTLADFSVEISHEVGDESWLELPISQALTVPYGWVLPNSQGCSPALDATGLASTTSAAPFAIEARNVLNNTDGLLIYSLERHKKSMGFGQYLFVRSPVKRCGGLFSGGNAGPQVDCSGVFEYDFNARIQAGVDSALIPGTRVFAQIWSRDPAAPATTNLTNAIEFSVFP